MRVSSSAVFVITMLMVLAGCGSSQRTADSTVPKPGSFSDGGVLLPYYGEELFENRIYVFGSKKSHDDFRASHQPNPLKIKSFIRQGPNHETVVVETDKEQPQQLDRLWRQFRARYHLAA